MPSIELLSQDTIDKISAGEVVERPASVVKELVENAIDAGATIITVDINKGGLSKIRVSDNGCGIEKNQVPLAFLRYSTSKIRKAEDLSFVTSLGFRGEALSSIAAVSQVELITKTKDDLLGTRYVIEGALEKKLEEIGAPNGTTFIVRNLFYNTPPRQKFLKSAKTEGNYITEIVERLSLSHPDIAFGLIVDGKSKISTVGGGKLKDCIYQIYGRSITQNVIKINESSDDMTVRGFIGNSTISRGNRAYENVYINGRYVKSKLLSNAIEEGFVGYLMQHQYPFCVLFIETDTETVDVNVHPTKLEVRIDNALVLTDLITKSIHTALHNLEDIRTEEIDYNVNDEVDVVIEGNLVDKKPYIKPDYSSENSLENTLFETKLEENSIVIDNNEDGLSNDIIEPYENNKLNTIKADFSSIIKDELNNSKEDTGEQLSFLSEESVKKHKIIGQLFDTYWLVELEDELYIIDQHAAHEKVLYEKTLSSLADKSMTTQLITPPIIVTLSDRELSFLEENIDAFDSLGYRLEPFGGKEYAINGIPDNIYGIDPKALFMDMIGECSEISINNNSNLILEKIASMSCKAAVKGNDILSVEESKKLIDDLISLDNPFHCPHGRPTIIKMTKKEIEKKFKRTL